MQVTFCTTHIAISLLDRYFSALAASITTATTAVASTTTAGQSDPQSQSEWSQFPSQTTCSDMSSNTMTNSDLGDENAEMSTDSYFEQQAEWLNITAAVLMVRFFIFIVTRVVIFLPLREYDIYALFKLSLPFFGLLY